MHVNKINGKKYIGITSKQIEQRWGKNGSGYRGSTYFYNAINKYGWNNFDHLIIKERLSEQEAKEMEIDLINKYNSTNSKNGYNLMNGGQGNIPNQVVRKKMSDAQKKAWNNPEHRAKMIKLKKKLSNNEEFKMRISLASKRSWKNKESRKKRITSLRRNGETKEFKEKMKTLTSGEKNGFYGRTHKKESKEKIRTSKLGSTLTEEHKLKVSESLKKQVVKLSLDGEYLGAYNGISHINEGYNTSHISSACRGKRKTAGGYKWMYKEDYEQMLQTK
jgi:hypothetical protein